MLTITMHFNITDNKMSLVMHHDLGVFHCPAEKVLHPTYAVQIDNASMKKMSVFLNEIENTKRKAANDQ